MIPSDYNTEGIFIDRSTNKKCFKDRDEKYEISRRGRLRSKKSLGYLDEGLRMLGPRMLALIVNCL